AGENLVPVCLVSDVPDDLVARSLEAVVQGDRELDRSQAGGEMPSRLGDDLHHVLPQFGGELLELSMAQVLEVGGRIDARQDRLGARSPLDSGPGTFLLDAAHGWNAHLVCQ